jgi:TetR/AcrR family transcriptional repressor of nem operon
MQEHNATAAKILDVAEHFMQTRGFNDFSYRDIQNEVGVKTSSIHYYFPTKQDLVIHLIDRYAERFTAFLNNLAQTESQGLQRIESICTVYAELLEEDKFCIYGMLASDKLALPEEANQKVCEFFTSIEAWLANAIVLGQEQQVFKETINAKSAAAYLLSSLEGGLLIARAKKQASYLELIVSEGLNRLKRQQ